MKSVLNTQFSTKQYCCQAVQEHHGQLGSNIPSGGRVGKHRVKKRISREQKSRYVSGN